VRIVHRLARATGIAKAVSPHSLRHTFVTLALDAGASLRDVQDSAGHADPRTTRRYDRGRHSLDRFAGYHIAAYVA
jgi:site-specific recombinase XerD